jgi:hypothetical protein
MQLPLSNFGRAEYRAIYGDPTLESYAVQAVGPLTHLTPDT